MDSRLKKLWVLPVLCAVLALLWLGRDAGEALPYHHRFDLAGVIPAEMKIYDPVRNVEALFRECEEEAERCVGVFNRYDPRSELSVINRDAASGDVNVSEDMREVLSAAFDVNRSTGGAFDVTVLPLITLWKEAGKSGKVPEPSALKAAREKVGMDKVVFDREKGTVRFTRPGVKLDLGGVSKGYIVDRVTELLLRKGVGKALVNIGGDMRLTGGTGRPFTIGVRDPRDMNLLIGELEIETGAVATSGDYARYVVIEGRQYSHIIDPKTGMPVSHSPSVTVISKKAISADALATGISVLGADGIGIVERWEETSCLIIRLEDGRPEFVMSKGMGEYLR